MRLSTLNLKTALLAIALTSGLLAPAASTWAGRPANNLTQYGINYVLRVDAVMSNGMLLLDDEVMQLAPDVKFYNKLGKPIPAFPLQKGMVVGVAVQKFKDKTVVTKVVIL